MIYRIGVENGLLNLAELFPLYQQHYAEMAARLAGEGVDLSPLNPAFDRYAAHVNAGSLITYVARTEGGEAVGYCNMYVTVDMHNQDVIAQEDTVFVTKSHRNGVGRRLVKFALDDLRARGVKRLHVTAATDPRATKLWERMGFKPIATAMIYDFERAV